MAANFDELLGDQLLQHNESNEIPTIELNGKTVALYFSAHWCGPCRSFTTKLVEAFKEVHDELKDKLDIVFVSRDRDQASFDEYYKEMPWKALPFSDRDRSNTLVEKFNVEFIPALVVLSPTCDIITIDGLDEMRIEPKETLHRWSEGKRLFWSRQAREDEYIWKDITCIRCYMNPLIGKRYGCTYRDCQVSLCETCSPKYDHEHPFVEFLYPKQQYSFEEFFKTVPYLLNPNNAEKIETKTIWDEGVKAIGFYFASQEYPPCRDFTTKLIEFYKEAETNTQSFRLVFVSCDENEKSFEESCATMPWPAIPFNSARPINTYFQFPNMRSIYVLSSNGNILSRHGRNDVLRKGIEALKTWACGETLSHPTADEFPWSYIACNGCDMWPLIGQRYFCSTCGSYDLCSTCEKKGHEHPLELVPPPAEEEDD